jgi:hypothetical protein
MMGCTMRRTTEMRGSEKDGDNEGQENNTSYQE